MELAPLTITIDFAANRVGSVNEPDPTHVGVALLSADGSTTVDSTTVPFADPVAVRFSAVAPGTYVSRVSLLRNGEQLGPSFDNPAVQDKVMRLGVVTATAS